jgi:hypothetical protein
MKRVLSIFLSILILLTSLKDVLTITHFLANRSYITKYLCENRFKPELKCHGQCKLMQKLKKNNEEKQNKARTLNDELNSTLFIYQRDILLLSYCTPAEKFSNPNFILIDHHKGCKLCSIFHPPQNA